MAQLAVLSKYLFLLIPIALLQLGLQIAALIDLVSAKIPTGRNGCGFS